MIIFVSSFYGVSLDWHVSPNYQFLILPPVFLEYLFMLAYFYIFIMLLLFHFGSNLFLAILVFMSGIPCLFSFFSALLNYLQLHPLRDHLVKCFDSIIEFILKRLLISFYYFMFPIRFELPFHFQILFWKLS